MKKKSTATSKTAREALLLQNRRLERLFAMKSGNKSNREVDEEIAATERLIAKIEGVLNQ